MLLLLVLVLDEETEDEWAKPGADDGAAKLAFKASVLPLVLILFSSSATETNSTSAPSHNFSSLVIFEAIFLKPIEVPEIRLNRIPFNDNRGSLQTSISHCTSESVYGSP